MRLKSAFAAVASFGAALVPAAALAAQAETLEQKDCALSAAGLLPTIPDLRVVEAVAKADASPDTYTVLVTVEAIGRTATYEFTCVYDKVDGALVEGGRMRQ
ncbi:MAG: hypothetical protein LDL26_03165 [Caenispirillum bisanense]|nr:hypothetical protein [Caenispirillum bisanense]MCA1972154.1 hypothetical protein [Caenispirillum sp.]